MVIACPVCLHVREPAVSVRVISICGFCGASLVVDASGQARRATAVDTATCDVTEMQQLVHARGALARPGRRAR